MFGDLVIGIFGKFIEVAHTFLFSSAHFFFLRRTEVFKLAPIAAVMPFLRGLCSVGKMAFERKAGPTLL